MIINASGGSPRARGRLPLDPLFVEPGDWKNVRASSDPRAVSFVEYAGFIGDTPG